jgi:hypothetical protein
MVYSREGGKRKIHAPLLHVCMHKQKGEVEYVCPLLIQIRESIKNKE